jgi:hypothetical protein
MQLFLYGAARVGNTALFNVLMERSERSKFKPKLGIRTAASRKARLLRQESDSKVYKSSEADAEVAQPIRKGQTGGPSDSGLWYTQARVDALSLSTKHPKVRGYAELEVMECRFIL